MCSDWRTAQRVAALLVFSGVCVSAENNSTIDKFSSVDFGLGLNSYEVILHSCRIFTDRVTIFVKYQFVHMAVHMSSRVQSHVF
jgi:hypothetical protein